LLNSRLVARKKQERNTESTFYFVPVEESGNLQTDSIEKETGLPEGNWFSLTV